MLHLPDHLIVAGVPAHRPRGSRGLARSGLRSRWSSCLELLRRGQVVQVALQHPALDDPGGLGRLALVVEGPRLEAAVSLAVVCQVEALRGDLLPELVGEVRRPRLDRERRRESPTSARRLAATVGLISTSKYFPSSGRLLGSRIFFECAPALLPGLLGFESADGRGAGEAVPARVLVGERPDVQEYVGARVASRWSRSRS